MDEEQRYEQVSGGAAADATGNTESTKETNEEGKKERKK